MVNSFEDDEDEFINFDLATAAPIVQPEPLIEHQYAALEHHVDDKHRYEEPPEDFDFEMK